MLRYKPTEIVIGAWAATTVGGIDMPMQAIVKQEAQPMLTNPHDAFRGQSRSPNSSVPYVRHSFLLCNSNFVFKTRRFYDSRLQKMS